MWLSANLALADPIAYEIKPKKPALIRFTVDAPLDSIVGVSSGLTGTGRFDEQTGSGTAKVSIDLRSFRTGISLRDEDLSDRFFEVSKYPTATLSVHRISSNEIRGSLSLHGVDRVVKIPAKLRFGIVDDRPAVNVEARFEIAFAHYNIRRPQALFLKLGETAMVEVQATLFAVDTPKPEVVAATKPLELAKPLFARGAFTPVVTKSKAPPKPKFRYGAKTAEGRGERLLHDPSVGAERNRMTCALCHSTLDERRRGLVIAKAVKPNRTLFNAGKRGSYWQGLAGTPGKAATLCVRLFLLNQKGLSPSQEADVDAYVNAISPDDAVPALDYETLHLTRRSGLATPSKGDRKRGERLEREFCQSCHSPGNLRPPLTPGLYEPDYLVRRVRWLPGSDARCLRSMSIA